MIFQKVSKENAEKVFMSVYAGEALLEGRPVCFHFTGTKDGRAGYLCDAVVDAVSTIGIADRAIPSGAYGLVQVYGYREKAVTLDGTSIAAGGNGAVYNVGSGSSGYLLLALSVGSATGVANMFICANSASATTTAAVRDGSVFIRCI